MASITTQFEFKWILCAPCGIIIPQEYSREHDMDQDHHTAVLNARANGWKGQVISKCGPPTYEQLVSGTTVMRQFHRRLFPVKTDVPPALIPALDEKHLSEDTKENPLKEDTKEISQEKTQKKTQEDPYADMPDLEDPSDDETPTNWSRIMDETEFSWTKDSSYFKPEFDFSKKTELWVNPSVDEKVILESVINATAYEQQEYERALKLSADENKILEAQEEIQFAYAIAATSPLAQALKYEDSELELLLSEREYEDACCCADNIDFEHDD